MAFQTHDSLHSLPKTRSGHRSLIMDSDDEPGMTTESDEEDNPSLQVERPARSTARSCPPSNGRLSSGRPECNSHAETRLPSGPQSSRSQDAETAPRTSISTTGRKAPGDYRKFEMIYVDNKSLKWAPGHPDEDDDDDHSAQSFVAADMATNYAAIRFSTGKKDNAYNCAEILKEMGAHRQEYLATVRHDGCGSMKTLKKAKDGPLHAVKTELIPPHDQSLNQAEKLCNTIWKAARATMIARSIPEEHFRWCLAYEVYVHNRLSFDRDGSILTPYERAKGTRPDISRMLPFYSKVYFYLSEAQRATQIKNGVPQAPYKRASEGHFIGFANADTQHNILVFDPQNPRTASEPLMRRDYHVKNPWAEDRGQVTAATADPYKGHYYSSVTVEDGQETIIIDGTSSDQPTAARRLFDHTTGEPAPTISPSGSAREESADPDSPEAKRHRRDNVSVEPINFDPDTPEGPDQVPHGHLRGARPPEAVQGDNPLFKDDLDPKSWPEAHVDLEDTYFWMQGDEKGPHGTPPGGSPEFRTHPQVAADPTAPSSTRGGTTYTSARVNAVHLSHLKSKSEGVSPSRVLLAVIEKGERAVGTGGISRDDYNRDIKYAMDRVCNENNPDMATLTRASRVLAVSAMHDMSWKKILASSDRDAALKALHAEMQSLESTILTRVYPSDQNWLDAQRLATTGRILIDKKRNGKWKGRAVKQGFKEDKVAADGEDYCYYSTVIRLDTVRASIFRPNRGTRSSAIKDVATAYLQSDGYDGFEKYICFKNPETGLWEYYSQSGPIYGECSAAKRWEDTITTWFVHQGFTRGDNERSVFYHKEKDLLIGIFVDDIYADGDESDIKWIFDLLDRRFKCKDAEWLTKEEPLDYLGMTVGRNEDYTYISMHRYIQNMLDAYGLKNEKMKDVPMAAPVSTDGDDAKPLNYSESKQFMSILGSIGWLNLTARPDVAYAHSRIGQHMANPTRGALRAVKRVCAYLQKTSEYALVSPLHYEHLDFIPEGVEEQYGWAFFSDSDHAGNAEVQNKRRSQNGIVATLNGAPVSWTSKASSVAFASADIGEAHADISSAAAEIYCAGNASMDIMGLSYTVEESGIPFPKPFVLQIDNSACESFAKADARRSKLKHIDCRQEWIKTLRNKNIMVPKHVDTKKNIADLFTKILDRKTFESLVNMVMKPVHIEGLQLDLHKIGNVAERVDTKPEAQVATHTVPAKDFHVHTARFLKSNKQY